MRGGCSLLRLGLVTTLWLLMLGMPFTLQADEFRPALLTISEKEGGWVDITWKVPAMGEQVLALTPVLPEFLQQMGPGSGHRVYREYAAGLYKGQAGREYFLFFPDH